MAQVIEYDINVNAGGSVRTLQQMEEELAQLNDEIKDLDVNSKAFKNASKNIQGVTKELEKANKSVEGFTLDKKLEATDGAIKIVAGSVQGFTGALGLMGIESEAFDKITAQASSAIAFGTGIKDLSEGVGKLAKNLNISSIATKAYTVAQRVFNAVMSMNPLGILITSLAVAGGLIIAFKDQILGFIKNALGPFSGIIDKIVGGFTALGEAVGLVDDEQTKAQKAQIKRMEDELAVAQAKGEATLQMEKDLLLEKRKLLEEGTEDYEASLLEEKVLDGKMYKEKKDADQKAKDEQLARNTAYNEKLKAQRQKENDEWLEQQKQFALDQQALDDELRQAFLEQQAIKQEEDLINFSTYEGALADEEDLLLEDSLARNQRLVDGEQRKQMMLANARQVGLDNLISIAGAETNVGRALIIAKQVQLAKELFQEASKTLAFSQQAVARSTVAVAEGTAQTAKVGFPQNIPLLIGYAAQAAGIIGAIRGAVKASKESGNVQVTQPRVPAGNAPQRRADSIPAGQTGTEQASQQVVKAYVVAGDVTSTQEVNAKLNAKRTLG